MANKLVLEVVADANNLLMNLNLAQQAVEKFIKGAREAAAGPVMHRKGERISHHG